MKRITSTQNPVFRAARRLATSRGRKKQHRFLIDGLKEIRLAVEGRIELVELFVSSELLADDAAQWLKTEVSESIPVVDLPAELLRELAYGDRMEGMIAVASRPDDSLEQLNTGDRFLLGVVESAEKPGNLGAVFRSADGAGLDGLLIVDAICDPLHPNCIRSSLGAVFTVPWATCTGSESVAYLQSRRASVYAALADTGKAWFCCRFAERSAIVVGNEARGLSDLWRGSGIEPVHIPMTGKIDSLNLSVSSAILFFEAARQRNPSDGEEKARK